MNMDKSLYEIILQNIEDGKLSDSFKLPDEPNEIGVPFADGAMDGITVYHMGRSGIDASGTKQMIKAIKFAAAGNAIEADNAFAELGKSFRAISIIDELQNYIIKHSSKLHAGNVHQTAKQLVLCSRNRESVKYGLSILELFTAIDEQTKEVIRRIGLSDEFTIFAVWNMLRWENANDEVFRLIQNVHGWGRIHALERLEADTPEIRKWMIAEGIQNNVMPAYSALTVWQKANVSEFIRGTISKEEFSAVGQIISGLLDEGPVPGISEIENAEDVLSEYLMKAAEFDLDIDDYETIFEINVWASDEDVDLPNLIEECMEILSSQACEETIREAVKDGSGLRLASALDVDYADDLLACLRKDFDGHYHQSSHLMALDGYVGQVLDLFRENLPLEQMHKDPENELGLGPGFEPYNKLEVIVQELGSYPNTGEDLIVAGLWSPVTRSRNMALRALETWTKALQSPISNISEHIYRELQSLYAKEPNVEVRERIQKLIDGIIADDADEEEYEGE